MGVYLSKQSSIQGNSLNIIKKRNSQLKKKSKSLPFKKANSARNHNGFVTEDFNNKNLLSFNKNYKLMGQLAKRNVT